MMLPTLPNGARDGESHSRSASMYRATGRNQTSERKAMAKKRAPKRRAWNKSQSVSVGRRVLGRTLLEPRLATPSRLGELPRPVQCLADEGKHRGVECISILPGAPWVGLSAE